MKKNNKIFIIVVAVLLSILFLAIIGNMEASKTAAGVDGVMDNNEFYFWAEEYADYIHYNEFVKRLENGDVDDVYYCQTEEYMVVTLFNEESRLAKENGESYTYTLTDIIKTEYTAEENFRKLMLSYNVDLYLARDTSANSSNMVALFVTGFLPVILTAGLLFWWMKSAGSPVKGMKKEEVIQTSDVKLDDIIGLDETKEELEIIIKLIKNSAEGEDIGAKIPHGILLSGPPGVGKTMIAKAVSNAAGVPFISMNGSDFQEIYVGTGAKHVRELFKIARDNAPCIIFIDEFDAIGTSRESHSANSEDRRTINALLKEMDGFKPLDKVFVLAATNHPDQLDPAIVRSGRFDREIQIAPPRNWKDRLALFKHYFKDKKLAEDVDLENHAITLAGFTGADIASVCNEAALVALGKGQSYIDDLCVVTAIDKKIFKGSYSKSKVNEEDRRVVAYHEAGHAVASIVLGQKVSRASIKSTTSGVGGAVFHVDSDSQFITEESLKHDIMVSYAGRVAEEIFMKNITAGASNDIEKASANLKVYIGKFGFDEITGPINLQVCGNMINPDYVMERLTVLSKAFMDETRTLLKENNGLVEKLAEKLLEVETMSGSEIIEFLNPEINKEASDE